MNEGGAEVVQQQHLKMERDHSTTDFILVLFISPNKCHTSICRVWEKKNIDIFSGFLVIDFGSPLLCFSLVCLKMLFTFVLINFNDIKND